MSAGWIGEDKIGSLWDLGKLKYDVECTCIHTLACMCNNSTRDKNIPVLV